MTRFVGNDINAEMKSNDPLAKYDPVNNPKHYDLFPDMQSIDILQRAMTEEEFIGFLKGNCLKYRLRAGSKDNLQQDIDKANWYQNKLREVMAGMSVSKSN